MLQAKPISNESKPPKPNGQSTRVLFINLYQKRFKKLFWLYKLYLMTPIEYYNTLGFVALGELLNQHSQEKIENLLATFQCTKNPDLEEFLSNPSKAIQSEQRAITRTYLYLESHNDTLIVMAYFSIAIKIYNGILEVGLQSHLLALIVTTTKFWLL